MTCSCEGNTHQHDKHFPDRGFTIINPSEYVLLRKVAIPASLGDETDVPVEIGKSGYCNVILEYEKSGNVYLYSSDGIPTKVGNTKLEERVAELEKLVADLQTKLEEKA